MTAETLSSDTVARLIKRQEKEGIMIQLVLPPVPADRLFPNVSSELKAEITKLVLASNLEQRAKSKLPDRGLPGQRRGQDYLLTRRAGGVPRGTPYCSRSV